jgi:hypothetical protein
MQIHDSVITISCKCTKRVRNVLQSWQNAWAIAFALEESTRELISICVSHFASACAAEYWFDMCANGSRKQRQQQAINCTSVYELNSSDVDTNSTTLTLAAHGFECARLNVWKIFIKNRVKNKEKSNQIEIENKTNNDLSAVYVYTSAIRAIRFAFRHMTFDSLKTY